MIIQFPSTLVVNRQTWGQQRQDIEFRSMFGAQAVEGSGPLWVVEIEPPETSIAEGGGWQSVMMQLRGRTNQLALWNMGRSQPVGTMRGAMSLSATAQGATALTITASGQAGLTLRAGDYVGVGSGFTQQVVMILDDSVANASGVISVATEPPLRNSFAAGSTVTWDQPRALFRRSESASSWDYASGQVSGMAMSLIEDWRP